MANEPIRAQNSKKALNQLSEEFLEALLQEEAPYPWNPAEPEAEAYFAAIEQNFSFEDWSESEEIAPRAKTLFSHLHQCWESIDASRVRKSLAQQFGNLVPSSWLEAIAERAEQMFSANISPVQQLVECVKPLLSNWTEEDLRIFARPLAYAMRGSTEKATESAVKLENQVQWDELSQVEQVRLSMAIARYALVQLQAENQE